MTSKDTDSQGKGDNRAKHTHTGIDITWLLRYLGIKKGPSKTAPKSNSERAKELYGPLKSIVDDVDNDTKGTSDPKGKEEKELTDADRKKAMNTRVAYRRYPVNGGTSRVSETPSSLYFLNKVVKEYPEDRFVIERTTPNDTDLPYFTKGEISNMLR